MLKLKAKRPAQGLLAILFLSLVSPFVCGIIENHVAKRWTVIKPLALVVHVKRHQTWGDDVARFDDVDALEFSDALDSRRGNFWLESTPHTSAQG
jgi:hypothetical protein